ncbi:unnamed protein product [Zymoseptoria tritici ST99CH_1E4]|uniref:Uncharacterized protein n=1 Tax=Zymoseptoria tritici ST99CH_1E4 TaxID=1276532 RepID=A0A2H1G4M3_ZYMTR|nr:unnamed protein product [Zymoseptoria tritici ST99CH_1E4]
MELSPKFQFWKKLRSLKRALLCPICPPHMPSFLHKLKATWSSKPTSNESNSQYTHSDDMNPLPPDPAESIAPDDLTAIPLPPPRILPANDSIRHISPSTALLQRYKSRAGGSQSLPDIGRNGSITSPKEVHHRATASTENILDFEGSPLADKSDRSGRAVTVRASRFTTPLRFNMLKPGDKASSKPKSASESDIDILTAARESFSRRSTRSQTRRDERVDSFRNSNSSQSSSSKKKNSISVDVPPGLNIRKKNSTSSRSPSPPPPRASELRDGSSLPMPPSMDSDMRPDSSSSANSEDELQAPRNVADGMDVPAPLKLGTKKAAKRTSQPFTQLPLPPVVLSKANPSAKKMTSRTSKRINLVSSPDQKSSDKNIDPTTTNPNHIDSDSTEPLPSSSSSEETEIYPLALRPPLFNEFLGLHQWESPHPSSSRPSSAWGWSKRWTCCACGEGGMTESGGGTRKGSTTIVEQVTCSNLGCGHLRCLEGCRLIKEVAQGSGRGRERGF